MAPRADPAQQLYASWLTHQLRAHLHLLDREAELLGAGPLTPVQACHIATVRSIVRRVAALLDDAAGISRLPASESAAPSAPEPSILGSSCRRET